MSDRTWVEGKISEGAGSMDDQHRPAHHLSVHRAGDVAAVAPSFRLTHQGLPGGPWGLRLRRESSRGLGVPALAGLRSVVETGIGAASGRPASARVSEAPARNRDDTL